MCDRHGPLSLTRRHSLRLLLGAATAPVLAGCDQLPVDLVPDGVVEQMGLEGWQRIRQQVPLSQDASLQSALQRIGEQLLAAAGEDPARWEMRVFASPDINAFALPGGKIGVFEGMFRVAANEHQLAAVVGHEIGHNQAEHAKARMTASVAKDWGLRLISIVLQLGDVEYAAEIAAALGIGAEYGLFLPYSRRQELEADRLGLFTMARSGFDPREAVSLWRRMDQSGGSRLPEFLGTHPAPEARIEAIEAMLPEVLGRA